MDVGGRATLSDCLFSNCLFSGNEAETVGQAGGGAIFTEGAALITGCVFRGNIAGGADGGVCGYGDLTIRGSVFSSNIALAGLSGVSLGAATYFDEPEALSCARHGGGEACSAQLPAVLVGGVSEQCCFANGEQPGVTIICALNRTAELEDCGQDDKRDLPEPERANHSATLAMLISVKHLQ